MYRQMIKHVMYATWVDFCLKLSPASVVNIKSKQLDW